VLNINRVVCGFGVRMFWPALHMNTTWLSVHFRLPVYRLMNEIGHLVHEMTNLCCTRGTFDEFVCTRGTFDEFALVI